MIQRLLCKNQSLLTVDWGADAGVYSYFFRGADLTWVNPLCLYKIFLRHLEIEWEEIAGKLHFLIKVFSGICPEPLVSSGVLTTFLAMINGKGSVGAHTPGGHAQLWGSWSAGSAKQVHWPGHQEQTFPRAKSTQKHFELQWNKSHGKSVWGRCMGPLTLYLPGKWTMRS